MPSIINKDNQNYSVSIKLNENVTSVFSIGKNETKENAVPAIATTVKINKITLASDGKKSIQIEKGKLSFV